jgi:hypothetical protein
VTDIQTGLQWMRFSLGQEWKEGTCIGEARKYTWQEALDVAETLNRQGGYAGHRDWRVPIKDELQTLVNSSRHPAIHPSAFPNTPASWYWSSSPYAGSPGYAWNVGFNAGYVNAYDRAYSNHARLVRWGQ